MAKFGLPGGRRQPQQSTGIDWSNPLTKGLRDLSLLGGLQRYNAARKTFLSSNGTVDSDPRGPKITTDGTAYAVPGGYAVLPITVIIGFARLGAPTSGNHALWISKDDTTGNGGLYFRYEDAGTLAVLKSQTAAVGSGAFTVKPGGSLLAATVDSGNFALYGDGGLVASGTHAQTFVSDTSVIGSESSNAAEDHPNGIFYFHAVWDRALSADEIKRLSANPWQIFRPRKREIYLVAAASGAADANSAGVATVTGVSGAIAGSDGVSVGVGAAPGISGVIAGSVASSAGTSTAQADTSGTIAEATASSAGTSTASGISGAIQGSVGASSGLAIVTGVTGNPVAQEETSYARKARAPNFAPRKEPKQPEAKKKPKAKVEKVEAKQEKPGINRLRVVNNLIPPDSMFVLMEKRKQQQEILEIEQQEISRLIMYNIRARAALLAA